MKRIRQTPEQIIRKLKTAEQLIAQGRTQGRLKVRHKAPGAAMLVAVLSGLLPSVGRLRCHC